MSQSDFERPKYWPFHRKKKAPKPTHITHKENTAHNTASQEVWLCFIATRVKHGAQGCLLTMMPLTQHKAEAMHCRPMRYLGSACPPLCQKEGSIPSVSLLKRWSANPSPRSLNNTGRHRILRQSIPTLLHQFGGPLVKEIDCKGIALLLDDLLVEKASWKQC